MPRTLLKTIGQSASNYRRLAAGCDTIRDSLTEIGGKDRALLNHCHSRVTVSDAKGCSLGGNTLGETDFTEIVQPRN